jgi:hypothetical protein
MRVTRIEIWIVVLILVAVGTLLWSRRQQQKFEELVARNTASSELYHELIKPAVPIPIGPTLVPPLVTSEPRGFNGFRMTPSSEAKSDASTEVSADSPGPGQVHIKASGSANNRFRAATYWWTVDIHASDDSSVWRHSYDDRRVRAKRGHRSELSLDEVIPLPPGNYQAYVELREELHARDSDTGKVAETSRAASVSITPSIDVKSE